MAAQKRCVLFRMRGVATAPSGQRQTEPPSPVHEADLHRSGAGRDGPGRTLLPRQPCPRPDGARPPRFSADLRRPLNSTLVPPRFAAFNLAICPPEFWVAAGRRPPAVACTATGVR